MTGWPSGTLAAAGARSQLFVHAGLEHTGIRALVSSTLDLFYGSSRATPTFAILISYLLQQATEAMLRAYSDPEPAGGVHSPLTMEIHR